MIIEVHYCFYLQDAFLICYAVSEPKSYRNAREKASCYGFQ